MQIEIESDKPVPPASKRGRRAIYPFPSMELGDSFLVKACETMPDPMLSLKATVSLANKKYAPKKFVIRRESVNVRIFRTV